MNYAIIAAGEGSRLKKEGVLTPKPLIEIKGEPLIYRLMRIFSENNAETIYVICNDFMLNVSDFIKRIRLINNLGNVVEIKIIIKTTPSSMHSMYELSKLIDDKPFCATTTDSIFKEDEFTKYIKMFENCIQNNECDALMGVTSFIDDEKPLYVRVDNNKRIIAYHNKSSFDKHVSAGIYALTPQCIDTLKECIERGESRMRNFQKALIKSNKRVFAFDFSKALDIDHASDIIKAEQFLNT